VLAHRRSKSLKLQYGGGRRFATPLRYGRCSGEFNHVADPATHPARLAVVVFPRLVEHQHIPSAREAEMSVAKVSEISATSAKSFDDAIQQGLTRANKTLRDIQRAWVKEQHVRFANGRITEYQVNMLVTFVLED